MTFRKTLLISLAALAVLAGVLQAYNNNQDASLVIGQGSFTTANPGTAGVSLTFPGGVGGEANALFVPDSNNHRVLIYDPFPASNFPSAFRVLGQGNFSSATAGAAAVSLNGPQAASSNGATLFVADSGNNRILAFSLPISSNQQAAVAVIGQGNFSTNGTGSGATGMNGPRGVFATATRLYVADTFNNRVLLYPLPLTLAGGASAATVLGQANFSTVSPGLGAGGMSQPRNLWVDANRLYVADTGNNRVLIFNLPLSGNGASANAVVGQTGFTTGGANQTGLNASGLNSPRAVAADPSGNRMFVADGGNNRVLIYQPIPSGTGAAASQVLGQNSFTTGAANQGGLSARSLSGPSGVWIKPGGEPELWVADTTNHRILAYDSCNAPTTPSCWVGDYEDPANHPVIACFSSNTDGWESPVFPPLNWAGSGGVDGTPGGYVWMSGNAGAGTMLFRRMVPAIDLGTYDRISFQMLNNNVSGTLTLEITDQNNNSLSLAGNFPLPSGAGWVAFDLPLDATAVANATEVRIRTVNAVNITTLQLDAVRLHHGCGNVWVRDPACCGAAPTPTQTATGGGNRFYLHNTNNNAPGVGQDLETSFPPGPTGVVQAPPIGPYTWISDPIFSSGILGDPWEFNLWAQSTVGAPAASFIVAVYEHDGTSIVNGPLNEFLLSPDVPGGPSTQLVQWTENPGPRPFTPGNRIYVEIYMQDNGASALNLAFNSGSFDSSIGIPFSAGLPSPTPTATTNVTATPTFASPPSSSFCPGFGTTTTGNYPGGATGSEVRLGQYGLVASSAVTAIAFHFHSEASFFGSQVRVALFNDSGNNPGSLVVESALESGTLALGWNTVAVPLTVVPSGTYWLGVFLTAAGGPYNVTGSPGSGYIAGPDWTTGAPDPPTGGALVGTRYDLVALCGPLPTSTPTSTATSSPTSTPTRTATPSATSTFTNTRTFTSTATGTFTSTPTATDTRTATPTATDTRTSTPTATDSRTATSSATSTPTATDTRTATPIFTDTRTATSSATATSTATDTRTATPTATDSRTATSSATSTPTATDTRTASSTETNTRTATPTLTDTLVFTPTSSSTSSASSTPTPTPTATGTNTATETSTRTVSPTATETFTASRTGTGTQTQTRTATATPTRPVISIQVGPNSPLPQSYLPGSTDVAVLQVQVQNQSLESVDLTGFTFSATGTGNDSSASIPLVRLYRETPVPNGQLDGSDVPRWTGVFSGDDGSFIAGPFSDTIPPGEVFQYLLVYDFSAGAALGTYTAQIENAGMVVGQGITSVRPVSIQGTFPIVSSSLTLVASTATATNTLTTTPSSTSTSTATSSSTHTRTATPTETSSRTATPTFTDTRTATPTETDTRTSTPTQTNTWTATPTLTDTPIFTLTASTTPTPTSSATLTATPSASPTATATETSSASSTFTATRTATPTETDTRTSTPTQTNTWTATPTSTDTLVFTATRTSTPTSTATLVSTATATSTASSTQTLVPTSTSTASSTATLVPTSTSTSTSTQTLVPTSTSTASSTATLVPTATRTSTSTQTLVPTSTSTASSTATLVPTSTSTSTSTQTLVPTSTSTASSTSTLVPTSTSTSTSTQTLVPTATFTASSTSTLVSTATSTSTRTFTVTRTATPSATFTNSPVPTNTPLPAGTFTITPTPNAICYLYSNQFNPDGGGTLGMDVRVRSAGRVKVKVYNAAGERVMDILDGSRTPGNYNFGWNGHNDRGHKVGNGVYYILVETPEGRVIRKVIILK